VISKNAELLLKNRYCHKDESPDHVLVRTANTIGFDKISRQTIYEDMFNGFFFPNSPAIYNAGFSNMMHACCALGIEDNMKSIADFMYTMTMMFKHGAGVGANYSKLRSKDEKLSSGGSSSGVISLMKVVDSLTDYVKQGGYRRGANMSILDFNHPEIVDFCNTKLKGGLTNMNLSVMLTDDFMNKIDTEDSFQLVDPSSGNNYGKMKYRDLFDIIAFCAWSCGCPGLLFFDRINRDVNHERYPDVVITTTNPCSESPIPTNSLCCLGSMNLSEFVNKGEFNYQLFEDKVGLYTKALLNMNKIGLYPFDFMKEAMDKWNPIGLGVMGFADALIKMEIYYDSQACLDFIDSVGKIYKDVSEYFAGDSFYQRIIAPTGSLSILADCSSGIEPVFSEIFERDLTVGKIEETRDIYKSKYTRVAHSIEPEWHLKVQAKWQEWVDGGISKTVNLHNGASIRDVKNIFRKAWKLGAKGVTIYRNLSKDKQVLYTKGCDGESCYL
jgi:ribonucleoside-diphosphate reductase alpha chain